MSYSGKFKDKNNNLHPVTSVLYGTCDTAAATAAKVVTCSDFDTLMTGVTIRVKFANVNTAASPTVNINSTGAKSVYRFGSTAPVDGNSWNAGEVVELVYDGTSFFMTGADDIAAKQNATDNSLQTTDKTVVGAINEHEGDIGSLKSGLTNYEKQNNLNLEVANRKNLVKVTVSSEQWQGVTFVNNNDGTFTATGSNTGSNPIAFIIGSVSLINGERYEFTGCPSNGGINSYRIDLRSSGIIYDNIVDEGSGYSFTARQNATVDVCIRIAGNYSIPEGGLTFSPMIRPSFITDATFTPYEPSVNSRLNNLANPLGTYNVMGIFQTTQLYNNSYGIAVVTGFDPSIHTVTINSATFIDDSAVTLTYNTHTTKKGVVGFFVDDANAVGKLVNINITVS